MRYAMACWALGLLLSGAPASAQTVNFASLLDELIDRDQLARFPAPAYTCAQASSYDRGSVDPDGPGWFANMDRSFFVRVEERDGRKEYVLMDQQGPGAVVRFWATWHGPGGGPFSNGTLRFYLDGNPQPAIEGPAASVLDGGALCTGPLSEGVSPQTPYGQRGHNLYLPIPYARHCKITYETDVLMDEGARQGEALYYQINYRTYGAETKVESFAVEQLKQHADKLAAVQERLVRSGVDPHDTWSKLSLTGSLAPGKARVLVIDRPGAVRRLQVKVSAANLPQALRSTVLAIEFDKQAAVWCPLEAFFGCGYLAHPYRSWYTEVTSDGLMQSYWVMPFARQCRIHLINLA
ncbi:MAG: DUF2961 domain-containing protein, partial [Pirellulaceae bacterium]|nr:DUF2961 domain-containing protein [Pirellulaceae bacterium]